MRVLHLNNEKTWRGGERQTLLLACLLQKLGIENAIGCRPGTPLFAQASQSGLPVISVSGNPVLAPLQIARAARDFDILHCHTGRAHSFAALAGLLVARPLIITRRVGFLPGPSGFNRWKYRVLTRAVCVSQFVSGELQGWGVAPDKLMVIHDGLPQPPPARGRDELRQALGLKGRAPVIGHIGALEIEKDQPTLLRAVHALVGQGQAVQVVVIGEGRQRAELEALRRSLSLEQTVSFVGSLPEASGFLPAFDVFVLCSRIEGFPNVVLEAFAAEVPVVATAAGGTTELVRHEETGLLLPVGDPVALADGILRLLSNPALGRRLAATAHARLEAEFSVALMAQKYRDLYQSVLNKPPPGILGVVP